MTVLDMPIETPTPAAPPAPRAIGGGWDQFPLVNPPPAPAVASPLPSAPPPAAPTVPSAWDQFPVVSPQAADIIARTPGLTTGGIKAVVAKYGQPAPAPLPIGAEGAWGRIRQDNNLAPLTPVTSPTAPPLLPVSPALGSGETPAPAVGLLPLGAESPAVPPVPAYFSTMTPGATTRMVGDIAAATERGRVAAIPPAPAPPTPVERMRVAMSKAIQQGNAADAEDAARTAAEDAVSAYNAHQPNVEAANAWLQKNDPTGQMNYSRTMPSVADPIEKGRALKAAMDKAIEAQGKEEGKPRRLDPKSLGFDDETENVARAGGPQLLEAYRMARARASGVKFVPVPADFLRDSGDSTVNAAWLASIGKERPESAPLVDRVFRVDDKTALIDKTLLPSGALERWAAQRDGKDAASGNEVANILRQTGHGITSGTAQEVAGLRGTASNLLGHFVDVNSERKKREMRARGELVWSDELAQTNQDINQDIRERGEAAQDYARKYPVESYIGKQLVVAGESLPAMVAAMATGPVGGALVFGASGGGNAYAGSILKGEDADTATIRAVATGAADALIMRLAPIVGRAEADTVARTVREDFVHGAKVMAVQNYVNQVLAKAGTDEKIDLLEPIITGMVQSALFQAPGLAKMGKQAMERGPIPDATAQSRTGEATAPAGMVETTGEYNPANQTPKNYPAQRFGQIGTTSPGGHPIFGQESEAQSVATASMMNKSGRTGKAYTVEKVGEGYAVIPRDRPAEPPYQPAVSQLSGRADIRREAEAGPAAVTDKPGADVRAVDKGQEWPGRVLTQAEIDALPRDAADPQSNPSAPPSVPDRTPAPAADAQGRSPAAGVEGADGTEPWQQTREQMAKSLGSTWTQHERNPGAPNFQDMHRETVRQAIADGKPVPDAVRNDYPDLGEAATAPAKADAPALAVEPLNDRHGIVRTPKDDAGKLGGLGLSYDKKRGGYIIPRGKRAAVDEALAKAGETPAEPTYADPDTAGNPRFSSDPHVDAALTKLDAATPEKGIRRRAFEMLHDELTAQDSGQSPPDIYELAKDPRNVVARMAVQMAEAHGLSYQPKAGRAKPVEAFPHDRLARTEKKDTGGLERVPETGVRLAPEKRTPEPSAADDVTASDLAGEVTPERIGELKKAKDAAIKAVEAAGALNVIDRPKLWGKLTPEKRAALMAYDKARQAWDDAEAAYSEQRAGQSYLTGPVSKLDALEARGREGLKALRDAKAARVANARAQGKRPGTAGGPLTDSQEWPYLAMIAAAKIGKGAQRFTTWAAEMLKEFPELSRQALAQLWREARRIVNPSTLAKNMDEAELSQYILDRITVPQSETTLQSVRQSAGMVRDRARVVGELEALRVKLRAEARGAREGYREGVRDGVERANAEPTETVGQRVRRVTGQTDPSGTVRESEALAAAMRGQAIGAAAGERQARATGTGLRQELARIIRENLPAGEAGKLLGDVARADTPGKVAVGIQRALRVLADHEVRESLRSLEDITGNMQVHVIRPPAPRKGESAESRVMGDVRPDELKTVNLKTLPKDVRDEVAALISKARYLKDRLRHAEGDTSIDQKRAAVDEFSKIDREIRQHVANYLAAEELRIGDRLVHRDQVAREIIDKLGTDGKEAPRTSAATPARAEPLKNLYGRQALNMDAIATNMVGEDSDAYRLTIGEVRKAQSEYYSEQRRTHEAFEGPLEKAGIPAGTKKLNDWLTQRETLDLPDTGKLALTRNEMLDVAAMAGDPQTRLLIQAGVPWSFGGQLRETPWKLTPKDIAAIRAKLRPEELALIDAFDRRNQELTPAAMRAKINLSGWAPEPHERYFPRSRNRLQGEEAGLPEGWRGYMDRALENVSQMEDRAQDVKQPMRVKGFITRVFDHFDDTAKLIWLAEPVRNVAAVWTHPDAARAVTRKYGESMMTRINQYLADTMMVRAAPPAGVVERAWQALGRGLSRAWLQGNISPIVKNIFGGTSALLPEFEAQDLAAGTAKMYSPEVYRRMIQGSGVAWHRYQGGLYGAYSPLASGRVETVAEMTFKEAFKATAAAVARLKPGEATRHVGEMVDALPFMAYADSVPLRAAWAASEHFVERTRPDLTGDEKAEAIRDKFETAIYRSQNGTSSTEISGFASSAKSRPVLSAFLMFKSDQAKRYSRLAMMKDADAATRAKTLLAVAINMLVTGATSYGIKQGFTALGRAIGGTPPNPKDEKRMKEGAAWDAAKSVTGVVPLGGLATDLAEAVSSDGKSEVSRNPIEDLQRDLAQRGVKVARGVANWAAAEGGSAEETKAYESLMKDLWKSAKTGAVITGNPAAPWMNWAQRAYEAATYTPPDPRMEAKTKEEHALAAARKTVPKVAADLIAERARLGRLPKESLTTPERVRMLRLDQFEESHGKQLKELKAAMESGDQVKVNRVRAAMATDAKNVDRLPADPRLLQVQDIEQADQRVRHGLPENLKNLFTEHAKLTRLAKLGRQHLTPDEHVRLAKLGQLETVYRAVRSGLKSGDPEAVKTLQDVARDLFKEGVAAE